MEIEVDVLIILKDPEANEDTGDELRKAIAESIGESLIPSKGDRYVHDGVSYECTDRVIDVSTGTAIVEVTLSET